MITTRTRFLSILATVAMLVSMLACFVIPASAAELDELLAAYEALRDDVGKDANDAYIATSLAEAIDAQANAENLDEAAAALNNAVAVDKAAGKITLPTYKHGEKDYPRFAHHAAYDAAGYDGLNWSITEVADWIEMGTVANAAEPDANYVDTTGYYFDGVTFHLTDNVNFNQSSTNTMNPLGTYKGRIFRGTIDGHGYGFEDVYIIPAATSLTNHETHYNGLITRLGKCEIRDFGINSGVVAGDGGSNAYNVSTFGTVNTNTELENAPVFTRVWSGATLQGISNNHVSALAAPYANGNNAIKVNGFTFYGELVKNVSNARNMVYGIYGGNRTGAADYGKFTNIVTYPSLINVNTTSIPASTDGGTYGSAIFGFSDATAYGTAKTDGRISNVYGIGFETAYRASTYDLDNKQEVDDVVVVGRVYVTEADERVTMSPEAAAYDLNGKQAGAADPVYFTLVDGNIRPVAAKDDGTAPDNAITKVTVSGYKDEILYMNKGEIKVADFAAKLGLAANEISSLKVGGEDKTGSETFEITDPVNTEIVVGTTKNKQMQDAIAKYEGILTEHLAAAEEGKVSLQAFRDAANKVEEGDEDAAKAVLDMEANLDIRVTSDYKKLPQYKDFAIYKKYNLNKEWAIKEAEDWRAMVADSAAETPETFKGFTFHVLDDIDFTGITDMPALNHVAGIGQVTNTDATIPAFMGAIEGHGFAFKNVDILVTDTIQTSGGLIGRLGAGASINDFGVESGTIEVSGGNYDQVATFGEAVGAVSITKVWSGVTLISNKGTKSGSHGMVAHSQYSELVLNGAYFYGTLVTKGTENSRAMVIAGDNARGMSLYNALGAPIVSENITNSKAYACYKTTSASTTYTANIYGVGIPANHADIGAENPAGQVTSALEGAWNINRAQPAATGLTPVYFTLNANKEIRPNGTEDNRIVKYNVSVNYPEGYIENTSNTSKEIFENAGTAVDLTEVFGIYTGDGATITVTQGENNDSVDVVDGKCTINDDATIVVNYSYEALCAMEQATLQAELDKYIALDDQYLKTTEEFREDEDATAIGLPNFRKQIEDAKALEAGAKKLTALQDAVDAIANLQVEVTEDYTKVPAYSLHKTYEDYNLGNNWMILEPKDWTDMIAVSNAETPETFEGYTFHLLDDINFNDNNMKMLSANVDAPFRGTIDGHGSAFQNIKISVAPGVSTKGGLISYIGEGAVIKDFGVDSGLIEITDANSHEVSLFGRLVEAATLTNVWNGATLNVAGTGSYIAGIATTTAGKNSVISGAYFFGKTSVDHGLKAGASIDSENARGIGIYNTLSAPSSANRLGGIVRIHSGNASKFINNVAVGIPAKIITSGTTTATTGVNTAAAKTAEEGAYYLNTLQDETTAPVRNYYTFNKNGDIRPTSDSSAMIVKITITGDVTAEEYKNNGSEIDFATDLGLNMASTTKVYLNGETEAYTDDTTAYKLNGDLVIDVDYDLTTQMNEAVDVFSELDPQYLSNGDELTTLRNDRDAAIESGLEEDITAVLNTATAFKPAVWGEDEYTKLPAYSLYNVYKDYNEGNHWAIKEVKDWLAMVDASKTETFAGYTFHVLEDIDFEGERMDPLNYDGTVATQDATNPFKGTIDGHGNAFKDIKIVFTATGGEDSTPVASGDTFAGIIGTMAGGAVIRNFGVDSGSISTSVKYMDLGTFGHVQKNETATLQNVWSGVDLSATGGSDSASGIAAYPTGGKLTINGAYFFGSVSAASTYAIAGSNIRYCSGFYNTVGAPTTTPGYSMYWTNAADIGFANNFSVGYDNVYGWKEGNAVEGIDNTNVTAASPEEAGYKVNIAQNDTQTFEKVYYTITEDGVRPNGTEANQIRKITVMNGDTEAAVLYAAPGEVALNVTGATGYTLPDDETDATLSGSTLTVLGTGDVTVNVTLCGHSTTKIEKLDGNKHQTVCADACGVVLKTVDCTFTHVDGEIEYDAETGELTATYTGACSENCGNTVSGNCKYVEHAATCETDKYFTFACGREQYIDENSKLGHSFGEWGKIDETTGKQERECVNNCGTKEVQINGSASAEGVTLKAAAAGDIVITLPIALKSATLTFTVPVGYSITNIDSAKVTKQAENVYTVAGTVAGETLNVSIKSEVYAIGGTISVEISAGIGEDDTPVTPATAEAKIEFKGLNGDADGDGSVTILDALALLYVRVGSETEDTINAKNANADELEALDVNDVYEIVRIWLRDTVFYV